MRDLAPLPRSAEAHCDEGCCDSESHRWHVAVHVGDEVSSEHVESHVRLRRRPSSSATAWRLQCRLGLSTAPIFFAIPVWPIAIAPGDEGMNAIDGDGLRWGRVPRELGRYGICTASAWSVVRPMSWRREVRCQLAPEWRELHASRALHVDSFEEEPQTMDVVS